MHTALLRGSRFAAAALALLLMLGPAPVGPPPDSTTLPEAPSAASTAPDELIAGYLDEFPAHALVAVVLRDGEAEVHGYGQDAAGNPVDGDTPFRIASMSKSFTAALAMKLAERGDLDLDAPITSVLSEFEMADERAEDITVRMLLAHTSGLGGGSTRDLGRPDSIDPAALLADLRDETLGSEPGSRHAYSNTGYALAAAVIEELTGLTFEEALRTELLQPIGMTSTVPVANCAAAVDGVGSGHTVAFGQVLPYPEPSDNCRGSGGIVSTANDLTLWLRFHTGDGRTDTGERLLTQEGMHDLHTPQPGTMNPGDPNVDGYGLGWSFARTGELDLLEHGGALATWTSHMSMVRDADGRPSGEAAIVLTDTIGAPGVLARALAADSAGQTAEIPARTAPGPALVFGALVAVVGLVGAVGLVRARTWPMRRHRTVPRMLGLWWLVILAVLCAVAPSLLASLAFGSPLGLLTAWHWGAGMLPEVVVLFGVTALACIVVLVARVVALHRRAT